MTDDTFPLGDRSVRRIGFGAMQLAGPGAFGPPRDRDAALDVLRKAVELGVNHIDTAQYYGPDYVNDLIRDALSPYPDDLVLVSKVGAARDDAGRWLPAMRPEQLRAGVHDNLRSLGVDRLDAVNLRLMDGGEDFDVELETMISLRDEGLIAGIGLSNVTREQLVHAVQRTEIVCVQNALNLIERQSMSLLRECQELGIAFVPFFPLGSAFGGVNRLLTHPDLMDTADRLEALPSQVALAWLLDLAPNVLLIPGTSTLGHLVDNMTARRVHLDDDARKVLDAIAL
ncbi:oxidoreductase [Amorphoplanes digitatis]|uniref:Aryl-alcohol dehydrogenase-like predicted oxidoreductase n=1 Tax=Actinoplanes digitatis TaxID=1868 RepID=A0A7W7HSJ7_9ACTN|nr:oxidoreductase [Actinoplanes digitatis]MBB4759973.1 aryl-alcohol dehydrogenase-like predicted oxidoreductase [Actinoplanes digitatis]BFE67980.1 oxidoreductase [Actinoplanes digitatis]GID96521.1 oxidoreductase [Actinoplanes digitatis]